MSNKTNTYFGNSIFVFIVVACLILAINSMVGGILSGGSAAMGDMSDEAVAARIAPVGMLNTGAPIAPPAPAMAAAEAAPAAAGAGRSGKEVYDSTCFACHGTGAAGAPKFGDTDAWAQRIAQGIDTLLNHAVNGFQGATGVMPPRGTCAACSDDELKAAIEYMVENSK